MKKTPYDRRTREFAERWESVPFERVHESWRHLLTEMRGLALDIGAGSGRDAEWLANHGFEVVAVEPSASLRAEARIRHPSARIHWLEDALPDLSAVERLGYRYDLILLSAVWMHVPPRQRERAFRKISDLLAPSGLLVFTLKQGQADFDRKIFHADPVELELFGRKRALIPVPIVRTASDDALGRKDVRWSTVALRLPDDGTGALPLLRHIIVNDQKSATYKLALLRVLVRIADGARGMVMDRDETHISIPLGLVALYWARAFKPLLFPARAQPFPQHANPRLGLGFVAEGYQGLASIPPADLRISARFEGSDATHLFRALRDICHTIKRMPANYTTLPGSESRVFPIESRTVRSPRTHLIVVDRDLLAAFGTFRVPIPLWEAMSRYACWIEPAIVEAWCDLMRGYDEARGISRTDDRYREALTWMEPERNTRLVRDLVARVRESDGRVACVWSGRSLTGTFEVDHCLPFNVWPNNDLWNLLPAAPPVNQRKSDRLPSARILQAASERILGWWSRAYGSYELFDRYRDEAFASLPYAAARHRDDDQVFEAVLSGVDNQRLRLRADQQVEEWDG